MAKMIDMKCCRSIFGAAEVIDDLCYERPAWCIQKVYRYVGKIEFQAEDELYVIGDVVDRGEQPMEILLDMMTRANVYPLLGNHDLIALELLPKVNKTLV